MLQRVTMLGNATVSTRATRRRILDMSNILCSYSKLLCKYSGQGGSPWWLLLYEFGVRSSIRICPYIDIFIEPNMLKEF